ncbi:Elongation factor 1-gamma [Thelohanellus kitauei]|uniref:Elongation factor 1-gamma n=1 Tax=Thelohanellus kitauei TaxID=669202 RepID=A0A0C2J0E3_THEKT|nr:Elongation factor 1-gamma [Thelohanellus kitauei]
MIIEQLYEKIRGHTQKDSEKCDKKSKKDKEDKKDRKEKKQDKKESTGTKKQKAAAKDDPTIPTEPTPEKAQKNAWLSQLPSCSFSFDDWKRKYFNSDVEKEALPWLWEHFEPSAMSFWHGTYNFNQELDMGFKVKNLIRGVCSRIEPLVKIAFAVFYIAGTGKNGPGNYDLTCVWMFRGQGLAFELDPEFGQDADYFTFRKLDHENPEDRELIQNYFMFKDNIRPLPLYDSETF